MVARDNYLKAMDQFRVKRATGFDEKVTQSLIKVLKLPAGLKRSIEDIARSYTRYRPILEDVREALPDLPFYPVADEQPNLRDNAGLSQMFPMKRFQRQKFVKRYLELFELTAGDRDGVPLVLIYKWPHLESGVCLHTIPVDLDVPGVRFLFSPGEDHDRAYTFVIEPLDQLGLLLSEHGWTYA